jgi:hypothetical protein
MNNEPVLEFLEYFWKRVKHDLLLSPESDKGRGERILRETLAFLDSDSFDFWARLSTIHPDKLYNLLIKDTLYEGRPRKTCKGDSRTT